MVEPVANPSPSDIAAWRRTLAPIDFNRVWELLDDSALTRDQEEEMLAAAFASRHSWYGVGSPRNIAIADWQVSRVASVLGYADLGRRFAERSLETAREHELGPFITGFAHEGIARAAAEVDDIDMFTEHLETARQLLAEVEDDEEREVLAADLAEMSED